MRKRVYILGIIALLALCGCDVAGTGKPEPVTVQSKAQGLLSGWLRYESPSDGFTLDVPKSWQKLEVNGEDLNTALNIVSENNPGLAKYLDSAEFRKQLSGLARSGVRLLLYDTSSDIYTTMFATNLNVIRTGVPSDLTLDEVVDENLKELERAMGSGLMTNIKREALKMAGTGARKLYYTYRVNVGYGTSIDAAITQYLLVKDGNQYILTFSTTSDDAPYRVNEFDKIARTFKFR